MYNIIIIGFHILRSIFFYDIYYYGKILETKSFRNYYISLDGNDSNSGLSESESWKSLEKVSGTKFFPGDIINFRGGETFTGNLIFDNDEGTDSNNILITSYGQSKATILSSSGEGIKISNNGGFTIENLNILGSYNPDTQYSENFGALSVAINIFNYANKKCSNIRLSNLHISNFKDIGINIGGDKNPLYGYSKILIQQCTINNCGNSGINVWGLKYQDINIFGNIIFDIKGTNPHPHGFTGNGVTLSYVYNALLERNLIYNNGAYAGHSGSGIATGSCKNIIVRYNEIYGIKSNDVDGDAIDFDNGSDSCIAEYNYTHNNSGAGILISGVNENSGSDHNIVRYNISKFDGLRNNYSSVLLYSKGAVNNQIYNNTIISIAAGSNMPKCIGIYDNSTDTYIANNIFFSNNSSLLIEVDNSKHLNLQFQANSYYAGSGSFAINWGSLKINSFENFIRSTRQEISEDTILGKFGDPELTDPLITRDTINNPYIIDTLNAYKLLPESILINSGINLDSPWNPAVTDFYGTSLPVNGRVDIGAYEHR